MRRAFITLSMILPWGCGVTAVNSEPGPSLEGGSPVPSPDSSSSGGDLDLDASLDGDARAVPAGSALSFKSTMNQYVDFPNVPIPQDFTLEVWIRTASNQKEMTVIAEDRTLNTEDQFRLALTDTSSVYFTMTDSASAAFGLATPYPLKSSGPVPLGAWTHIAVTKSGADFALYMNATLAAKVTATSATFTRGNAFNLRFAARMGSGGAADFFDGAIDEVRLFDVARSPADIAMDMKTELPAATANLIHYFRLDENGGTIVHDDKQPALEGEVKGATWIFSDAF